jgi:hypothetical protein
MAAAATDALPIIFIVISLSAAGLTSALPHGPRQPLRSRRPDAAVRELMKGATFPSDA